MKKHTKKPTPVVPRDGGRLRILIALPRGQAHKLEFGPVRMSFREAPLTATTLAALVPAELDAEIRIVDESVDDIPFDARFDLVAISVLTGTSTRAYEIADHFRMQGATVVLGGVHVTLLPEEAKRHADAIVIGFAEKTWPRLLRDFAGGVLRKSYRERNVSVEKMPLPRRDLQKKHGYTMPVTVFATRGCRQQCDFCSVVAANFGWHKRPIPEVIDELRSIGSRRLAFNDVHLTDDPEYAKELFTAMIPLKKIWGGLASTRVVYDDELLDLLQRSGCRYLLLGFESFDERTLDGMNKSFNKRTEFKVVTEKLHDRGIIIQGCFIFGNDGEDRSVFSETVDLVNEIRIDIPRYAVYTPYPKTQAYFRLKEQGRLLHERWEYYDTQHVVHLPDRMSPAQLDAGFKWAFRKTFTLENILRRNLSSGMQFYITFVGNLAYRLYIRKLYADQNRFPAGIDPGEPWEARQ